MEFASSVFYMNFSGHENLNLQMKIEGMQTNGKKRTTSDYNSNLPNRLELRKL